MSIQVISFNCVLKNKAGKFISSTFNRDVLATSKDPNAMLAGLANGLKDLKKGEKRTISLSAEEAYGLYDPQKVILYPKKKMNQKLAVGESITIIGKSGKSRLYRVLQYHDDMVSLDGNHPLAGQDLIFEIETIDAREATREEVDESVHAFHTNLLH